MEEIGDDCDRTSDLLDTDGSDDGSDLVDFIVADNQATSSMRHSQPTSPLSSSQVTPSAGQQPYFVPTAFPATQESEGMPDLDELVGKKSGTITQDGAATRRKSRRPVVDDSDDSDFA